MGAEQTCTVTDASPVAVTEQLVSLTAMPATFLTLVSPQAMARVPICDEMDFESPPPLPPSSGSRKEKADTPVSAWLDIWSLV